ncbi:hypothetical protein FVE85_8806 [Porphyridium purpureum]|uniref:Nudix hydrolase domain-containing protein n=1 Tax=Porphyridium purpureum TaxID=35688 RepID=A0A5J4YPA9_PORPP|nr:hypothetical protein FVE85_8806 [Porphyridium purpureum]|eukprot:POR0539..scf296_7
MIMEMPDGQSLPSALSQPYSRPTSARAQQGTLLEVGAAVSRKVQQRILVAGMLTPLLMMMAVSLVHSHQHVTRSVAARAEHVAASIGGQLGVPPGATEDHEKRLFVVSEKNEPLDESAAKPVHVVHGQGLYHRAVWYVILNEAKQALLVLRSAKQFNCPRTWMFPAEHSLYNESWTTTARRGLEEELNSHLIEWDTLAPLGEPFLYSYAYPSSTRRDLQWTQAWVVFVKPGVYERPDALLAASENDAARFVSYDEFIKMDEEIELCHGTLKKWQRRMFAAAKHGLRIELDK